MAERSYLPTDVVERFMTDVFIALGVPEEDARISTDVLISSDLRGIESHGVGRLKYYYDRIVSGRHLPTTEFEIVKETETTALIDGHHGMGHPIANRAMRMAMDKAKRYGTGAVAVRNGTHFGIAGYYPLMAAAEGMVGFCFTNARPSIPPTFGTEPMMGTNPIAFAAPSDQGFPFCFDGATAIIQRGKVECAAREEKPLPDGTIVDPRGECLTDPDIILSEMVKGNAAALAIGGAGEEHGGHKGYGLAAMVEVLSASFCNGVFLKDLSGFAEDGSPAHFRLGHFFLAIDVEHFLPLEEFERTTGAIMRALQCSRKAPGQDRIYVAGEKERENEQRIRQEGIPANSNLLKDLATVRDELGIKGYDEYF
ncbi:MAG: Ldh family oxidoreductase [Candidatus Undinarchaeales archaeon]|jgi:LDH2 family malate/lactate/ureidoglycolate dehydrogenase|nr:Ldh family oxidoreductase [Candidatus Undinarchaeales archaeon]MDP7491617.1 Ldh family oxidoreductase [Candidatus Undinarchaeales archaeon]